MSVTVYLEEPAGTRVAVSADRGFTRGPREAPVAMGRPEDAWMFRRGVSVVWSSSSD